MRIYRLNINLNALVLGALFFYNTAAYSDVILKTEGVYFQNFLTTTNSTSANVTYFDFTANLTLSPRSNYFVGVLFSSYASTEKDSSATTTYWSEQNTGLNIGTYIGRRRQFSLSGAYMLISNANYKLGSSSTEIWQGTGYSVKASYITDYSEKLKISLSVIYGQNNYTTSRLASSISNVNKVRNYFLPILGVQFTF